MDASDFYKVIDLMILFDGFYWYWRLFYYDLIFFYYSCAEKYNWLTLVHEYYDVAILFVPTLDFAIMSFEELQSTNPSSLLLHTATLVNIRTWRFWVVCPSVLCFIFFFWFCCYWLFVYLMLSYSTATV